MKVIVFGATGMVGQGVLRACLLDPRVTQVTAVGRAPVGQKHDKLADLVHANLHDYSAMQSRLAGFDACFFCLGVSSAGMDEAAYTKITYDLTLAAAKALLAANTGMTFIYVSGASTDSSEKGRAMWARLRGRTENALLAMGFKAAYMFRPGAIQPMHGIKSRTTMYRVFYAVMWPLMPLLRALGVAVTTLTREAWPTALRLWSVEMAGRASLTSRVTCSILPSPASMRPGVSHPRQPYDTEFLETALRAGSHALNIEHLAVPPGQSRRGPDARHAQYPPGHRRYHPPSRVD